VHPSREPGQGGHAQPVQVGTACAVVMHGLFRCHAWHVQYVQVPCTACAGVMHGLFSLFR
jgi:hypothetical protein